MISPHLSSKTLAQAATLAERIETLESELTALLQGNTPDPAKQSIVTPTQNRQVATPKVVHPPVRKATTALRGTLRPAVVAILNQQQKPLKTAEIYDALVAQGYRFTFKEPKKVLGIRLYKMLGVKPLGEGLFTTK